MTVAVIESDQEFPRASLTTTSMVTSPQESRAGCILTYWSTTLASTTPGSELVALRMRSSGEVRSSLHLTSMGRWTPASSSLNDMSSSARHSGS